MVRPFSILHCMVQACGQGGRKTGNKMRRRVVFFLLFNNSDISNNAEISTEVRELFGVHQWTYLAKCLQFDV